MRRNYIATAVVAVFALTLMVMPGCGAFEPGSGSEVSATPTLTLPQLQQQVTGIDGKVNTNTQSIQNLTNALGQTTSIAAMPEFIAMQTAMDELLAWKAAIEASEVAPSGDEEGVITVDELDESTRWQLDAWLEYDGYRLAEVDLDHPRIDEEDDYRIYALIWNHNIADYETTEPGSPAAGELWLDDETMYIWTGSAWDEADMNDIYSPVEIDLLTIDLRPDAGDRVVVDTENTWLDNVGAPYLAWDTEVSTRSDGTCRKISGETTRKFTLPVPDSFDNRPENPIPYEVRVEFELYYAA